MTNEQLAAHVQHIQKRLYAALDTLKAALRDDLPDSKFIEVRIVHPGSRYYPPLNDLENLSSDLEEEVANLKKPF